MLTVGHVSNLINSPFAVCALHVFTLLLSTRMLRSDTPPAHICDDRSLTPQRPPLTVDVAYYGVLSTNYTVRLSVKTNKRKFNDSLVSLADIG